MVRICQPLPLCYVLSSPRFWEARDQGFPGSLSLSLAPGDGKERTLGTRLHLSELKQEKCWCERKWQMKYQTLKSTNKSERRQVSSAVENKRRNYYFDKVSTSTHSELFNLVDGLLTIKNKIILPIHIDWRELATHFLWFSGRLKGFFWHWRLLLLWQATYSKLWAEYCTVTF